MFEVLDAFPEDPSSLPTERLEAGFARLVALAEAVEARRLRWLAEVDRRRAWRSDGFLSTGAWLSGRFGVAGSEARREVRVAAALQGMPAVRDALSCGDVSVGAARVLASAREAHPEEFSEQEEALVERARTSGVDELRTAMSEWSAGVGSASAFEHAERLRERRRLAVCPGPAGMVRVDGELDPESGEAVMTALGSLVDSGVRTGGPDLRTGPQRWADALTELARRHLDGRDRPSVGGERPHLTVTVDGAALGMGQGVARLDHAGAIPVQTARRLGCDASVMRVVLAGPSQPLEVGRRTPVVSPALRRAVVLRDRSCRFPRCGRPHGWCDAHHVRHWADGGWTGLGNLVLLCRPHHRLVHEGGFGLAMTRDGPVFRRPDGTVIEDGRAPP